MRILLAAAIPLFIAGLPGRAHADFQYESTSRVTGGTLLQMMRFVPGGGKLKEPQVSTVAVQGNRMVRRSKRTAEIIDLDKRTITNVDFEKRTITEMTFDQMKQMLDQATQQMQAAKSQPDAPNAGPNNVNLNFDADVKSTGQTKTVNGLDAQQFIVTMSMIASDPQSGQSGAMKITSEMWIAKDIPGANELRDFQKRMAKELDWAPTGMGNMLNRPDVNQALGKLMAEGGKMDGTPIQQVVRIGGEASGMPSGDQAQQQSQPAPPKPSVSDAVGSALGSKLGALGGFGGFGRKKQNTNQDTSSNAQPANQQGAQQASASLMEMTVDSSGFSTAAVDNSLFEIPAGFKKLDPSSPGTPGK